MRLFSTGLAAMLAVTALLSFALLHRTPDWNGWLRYAVLISGLVASAWLALGQRHGWHAENARLHAALVDPDPLLRSL